MSKTFKKVTIEGTFTARQPIFQSRPDMGQGKKKNVSAMSTMTMLIGNTPRKVPIISANSIRAMLRDNIAMDMADKLGSGSLSYDTLIAMFSGGTVAKNTSTKEKNPREIFEAVRKIKSNNVLISLFGSAFNNAIVSGKVCVSNCVPACGETKDYIPGEYLKGEKVAPSTLDDVYCRDGLTNVRFDDMRNDKVIAFLSDDGMNTLIKKSTKLTGQKKRKAEEPQNPKAEAAKAAAVVGQPGNASPDDDSERSVMMPFGVDGYIVPKTDLYAKIEVFNATDIELGAIYSAFDRFSYKPYLGGGSSRGYGEVSGHFDVRAGSESEIITFSPFNCHDHLKAYEAYKKYISKLTVGLVEIPAALLGN